MGIEPYEPQLITTNPIFGVSNLSWAVRPKPLIEGFLPQKGIVVIAAAPHTGKTFLALEATRAIISAQNKGRPFLNKFPVTPRLGRVLILEQDSADWDFRTQYEKIMGFKIEFDPEDFSMDNFEESDRVAVSIKQIPWLDSDDYIRDLAYWANRHSMFTGFEDIPDEDGAPTPEAQYKEGFDAIILDSLAAMHNVEENDNRGMHAVINRMRLLSELTNTCVVVLHHINKGDAETRNNISLDRLRGASSIAAAADVVLGLSKKTRFSEEINMMVLKNRAFPEQRDIEYYMHVDLDAETVTLSVDSEMPGSMSFRRERVKEYLIERKGQYVDTNDLIEHLFSLEKTHNLEKKTYQNALYRILGNFEREHLIERTRGKVRWVVLPTGFPEEGNDVTNDGV